MKMFLCETLWVCHLHEKCYIKKSCLAYLLPWPGGYLKAPEALFSDRLYSHYRTWTQAFISCAILGRPTDLFTLPLHLTSLSKMSFLILTGMTMNLPLTSPDKSLWRCWVSCLYTLFLFTCLHTFFLFTWLISIMAVLSWPWRAQPCIATILSAHTKRATFAKVHPHEAVIIYQYLLNQTGGWYGNLSISAYTSRLSLLSSEAYYYW